MDLLKAILAFLVISFIGQIVYYYPNLPERMASHFNAFGEPDRWMSKSGFMIFESIILLLVIGEFTLLPSLIKNLPDSLINLPNKDYWLAAERRDKTFSILKRFFEIFSILLLMLFISVNEFVFRANLNRQELPNYVWLILLIFLAVVSYLTIRLSAKFKKTI